MSPTEALHNINGIIGEFRRLARSLSPAILTDLGFTAALKYLVNEFTRDHDIKCVDKIEELNDLVVFAGTEDHLLPDPAGSLEQRGPARRSLQGDGDH